MLSQGWSLLRDAMCIYIIFMIICKYVCGPLSLQVTISTLAEASCHTHMLSPPSAAWWFSSFIIFSFFWNACFRKSKKVLTSLGIHWPFFPEASAQPGFWQKPLKSGQGQNIKLFTRPYYTISKCMVCVLDFRNTSSRYTALSMLVIDSIPTFLIQLFEKWLCGFSGPSNYHLFL